MAFGALWDHRVPKVGRKNEKGPSPPEDSPKSTARKLYERLVYTNVIGGLHVFI